MNIKKDERQELNEERLDEFSAYLSWFFEKYADKYTDNPAEWFKEVLREECPDMSIEQTEKESQNLFKLMTGYQELVSDALDGKNTDVSAEQWLTGQIREIADADNLAQIKKQLKELNKLCQEISSNIYDDFDDDDVTKENGVQFDFLAELNEQEQEVQEADGQLQKSFRTSLQKSSRQMIKSNLSPVEFYDVSNLVGPLAQHAAAIWIAIGAVNLGLKLVSNAQKNKGLMTKEDIINSLKQGQNAGLMVVLIGALKLGAHRGLLPFLTPATPALIIVSIASVSVEGAKIMKDYASQKITALEALDAISRTSVATVFTLGFTVEGAVIGTAVLGVIPFGGAVVGGIIGGTIGNAAGAKLIQHERVKQFEQSVREMYRLTLKNIKKENLLTNYVSNRVTEKNSILG